MSQINISNLTFSYNGSYDTIFKHVSFCIDTNWKLGFIGRNGKGKTTFFHLLMGKYDYSGHISSNVTFEHFPYDVKDKSQWTIEVISQIYPDYVHWQLVKELSLLEADDSILYRPFQTLSDGEQTYIMLKPDAVQRGLMGEIIARIERKGYRLIDAKMMNLDEAILKEHYAHIADKPFFPDIVEYMTSGPVFGMIVEGENAVQGMRIIMGATKFEEATAGTIRGDFASSTGANVIHGSDSVENAKIEIKRFFNK